MGNVIDFGERGLALSLGRDAGSPVAVERSGERDAQWYADRILGAVEGLSSMRGFVYKFSGCSSGYVGLVLGYDSRTSRFSVAVLDGLSVMETFGYGGSDCGLGDAEAAMELFRCRLRNMGPRGGGKSKALELGRLKGCGKFAEEEIGRLDGLLFGRNKNAGGMA